MHSVVVTFYVTLSFIKSATLDGALTFDLSFPEFLFVSRNLVVDDGSQQFFTLALSCFS